MLCVRRWFCVGLCVPLMLAPAGCAPVGAGLNVTEEQRSLCDPDLQPAEDTVVVTRYPRQQRPAYNAGTVVAAGIVAGVVGVLALSAIRRAQLQECLQQHHDANERAAGRLAPLMAVQPAPGVAPTEPAVVQAAARTSVGEGERVVTHAPLPDRPAPELYACPLPGLAVLTTTGARILFEGSDRSDRLVCLIRRGASKVTQRRIASLYPADSMTSAAYRSLLERFLPCAPGKKVTGSVPHTTASLQWTFTLTWLGETELEVPAGRFSVFVAEEWQESPFYLGRRRWYFDRESWLPVKFEADVTRGNPWREAPWEARALIAVEPAQAGMPATTAAR